MQNWQKQGPTIEHREPYAIPTEEKNLEKNRQPQSGMNHFSVHVKLRQHCKVCFSEKKELT